MPYIDERNIEKKIEENLKLTQEIHRLSKRVNRWITFQKVWWIIQMIIIVLVLASAWIYIPPAFKNIADIYQKITGSQTVEEMKEGFPVEVTK